MSRTRSRSHVQTRTGRQQACIGSNLPDTNDIGSEVWREQELAAWVDSNMVRMRCVLPPRIWSRPIHGELEGLKRL